MLNRYNKNLNHETLQRFQFHFRNLPQDWFSQTLLLV